MLHLDERRAGEVVLEVAEADFIVVGLDLVGVDPWEEVRETAVEADLLTRLDVHAGVADVLDVALGAHQAGVGAVEHGDLAVEAADADVLDLKLGLAGREVLVDVHLAFARHRVDQGVAHDARLGAVRVVTEVAVHAVLDVPNDVNGVGAAVELRALGLVAHVGPVEHQVGRLAGPAHAVGGSGRARLVRLLLVVVGIVVLEDVPGLVGLAALKRRVEPAVLGLEAATERTVDDELVDRHERVGARKVVLLREAVAAERAVKERIGSRAIRRLLRLTSSTAVILIEGLVLRLMAAAAGSRIHVDRRTIRHLLQVLINARVAGRAGNVLVRGAGVRLGDIGVAGRAGRQISGLSGNACAQRKERGGNSRQHRLRVHKRSPSRAFECSAAAALQRVSDGLPSRRNFFIRVKLYFSLQHP